MSEIAENLARVRERMEAAALRSGRKAGQIRLVAVSKTVPPERVREAVDAGVEILGENYVQEAQKKIDLVGRRPAWHFIGHLQTNKAKIAGRLFDFIHSVDSLRLAEELSRAARRENKVIPILLQVNLAGEESKFGAAESDLFLLLEAVSRLEGVSVKGLMAMPPFFENAEDSRPYFKELRSLAESAARQRIPGIGMGELSMGMSNDFEVAIEEGATLVRVGTAVFGPRPQK